MWWEEEEFNLRVHWEPVASFYRELPPAVKHCFSGGSFLEDVIADKAQSLPPLLLLGIVDITDDATTAHLPEHYGELKQLVTALPKAKSTFSKAILSFGECKFNIPYR